MKRLSMTVRPDANAKLKEIGFSFHDWDGYWAENRCYSFTIDQINEIEAATAELHQLCLEAVGFAIRENRLLQLGIPVAFHRAIEKSWLNDSFTLYGRFDLAYDGKGPPKMLEYNADTPTSILETGVAQWLWLEDKLPELDQFNSLHERLIERFKELPGNRVLHLASLADSEEDYVNVRYLLDLATQAGLTANHLSIEEIGWDEKHHRFVDTNGKVIENLFKLYPWEWMMREPFGKNVIGSQTRFIEPLWKAVLSCKGILPILWELFPNHPNLLPAYFDARDLKDYVRKPLYSREGANIEVFRDGKVVTKSDGKYGAEGHVYQQLFELPCFDGAYPILGSWVVGDQPAGMCIREDITSITTNVSSFIPHFIEAY